MISQQLWTALDLPDRLVRSNSTSGRTIPVKNHSKVSTFYTFQVDNLIAAAVTRTRSEPRRRNKVTGL